MVGWLDDVTYYTVFTEGWGLYAEDPLIGSDTNAYKGKPLEKYGMLRGQVNFVFLVTTHYNNEGGRGSCILFFGVSIFYVNLF